MQFRRLEGSRPVRSAVLVFIALLFVGGFLTWLMLPSHWPRGGDDVLVNVASIIVTATTGIIGWFAFLNVATLCRATLLARDPVPVRPPEASGWRSSRRSCRRRSRSIWCARRSRRRCKIRHTGQLDVWLLDEGDDPDVKRMCAELGVNHFTRRGVARWNQPTGPAPGEEQARQLQRLAGRARRALRVHARRRPRPRAAARTSRSACSGTSATPTWRSSSARRCTATTAASWCARRSRSSSCSTRCCSARATARARRCWSAPTTPCG